MVGCEFWLRTLFDGINEYTHSVLSALGIFSVYFDALNIRHLKGMCVLCVHCAVKYAQQIRKVSLTSGNYKFHMKTIVVKPINACISLQSENVMIKKIAT